MAARDSAHLMPAACTENLDYSSLTDQQVVLLARDGRERAFRELIGRYQRPVFSLIYRIVRDREKAEDLAQDSFIKVLNAIDRYDPQFKFSSWIFKIAHNTALDHLRRKAPETLSLDGSPHARTAAEAEASTITPESHTENPEQYTANRELGGEIDVALGTLRHEYRTAIVLCHVEGRPYEEIAEIMGVPLGTVKTYIHRGRKELMQRLEHLRC
ncbi:MAG TPA: sigma-70 family RNA polymerase sigma factor [Longimicrobiales bacterium]|nr:sigma-70 family RNA polymerase sigma factor [Longimicrobiales bacterium]